MLSLWMDRTKLPQYAALEKDIKTQVLVIGGGMAGILCAYFLKEAGVDCVLVEGNVLCGWNTGNTTAKITAQHGLVYDTMLKEKGIEQTQMYLAANLSAVEKYKLMCRDFSCGFETKDSYVYSINDQGKLELEMDALERLGFHAQFADALKLPFSVVGAVKFPDQAQFDPVRFLSFLIKDMTIYEHTAVREMEKDAAITDGGFRIEADSYIVATHFPFLNKHGAYFFKMYQQRSYCIALDNAADVGGMYRDEAQGGFSFRNADGLLLLGGGSHRTGKVGGCWQELRNLSGRFYPKAHERCSWAAQDCMTLDGIPYIGPYGKGLPRVFVATGFNKWGMTASLLAGWILSDLVQDKKNPYTEVFNPARPMKKMPLLRNGLEATANLLTFSKKRCPHLGCALSWNAPEHSWDCPCHGSRFAADGLLLDNPATGDLK